MPDHVADRPRLAVRGGLEVLVWPLFDQQPVEVVVTTRAGGVSSGPYATLNLGLHVGDDPVAVVENRRRAATAIGLDLDGLVFCTQAHGRTVVRVDAAHRGRGARDASDAIPEADALVTRTPDLGLAVMMADCVPVVLFDPVSVTLACVHAGWRGTVARVVSAAVGAMAAEGARPQDVLAGIGPAIPPDRYQVGDEVAAAARRGLRADAGDVVTPDGHGRWLFDLWEANRRLLLRAGVAEEHVVTSPVPTGGDGPFFSDRAHRPCGRFAALARIRGDGLPRRR